jgi:hypothetical protein
MNCNKCKNRVIEVVDVYFCNQPYKYYCKKGKFKSYPSESAHGASIENNSRTFYTEDHLADFCSGFKICIDKYNLSSEAFWRLFFNFIAISLSIISLFFSFRKNAIEKATLNNEFRKELNNIVVTKIDSLYKVHNNLNSKSIFFVDDTLHHKNNVQRITTSQTPKNLKCKRTSTQKCL